MMAASVKHIIATGGILDTILNWASSAFTGTSPFVSSLLIYGLTLVLELFITSGSAKAFLLIPIIMPLADLVGVTRQIAVSAYCFGDGFSNMAYPTNAALLITLSLTVIPLYEMVQMGLEIVGLGDPGNHSVPGCCCGIQLRSFLSICLSSLPPIRNRASVSGSSLQSSARSLAICPTG